MSVNERVVLARVAVAGTGAGVLAALAGFEVIVALVARPAVIAGPLGGLLVPWPLLSCLAPTVLGAAWPGPTELRERTSARPPLHAVVLRLAPLLALVAAATLAVALLAPADVEPVSGNGAVAWRNAILMAGVALGAAVLLPRSVAWLAPVALILTCAAAGVPEGGEPYGWSLLTHPADDEVAFAAATLVFVAAVVLLLRRLRTPGR